MQGIILIRVIKVLVSVAMIAVATFGCGSSSDGGLGSPSSCVLSPAYASVAAGDSTYSSLTYQSAFSPECKKLVEEKSGGISVRLEVSGKSIAGHVSSLSAGGSRVLSSRC